jgi:hypothetical protein
VTKDLKEIHPKVPKVLRETHPKVAKEMLDLHHKVDKEPKVLRVIEDHKVVREIVVLDLLDLLEILHKDHKVHKETQIQVQQDLVDSKVIKVVVVIKDH